MKADPEEVVRLVKEALRPLPDVIKRDSKELATTLTADDDPALGPLLRFHLLAEQLFNRLIALSFARPGHLERFRFVDKLRIIYALGEVSDMAVEGMQRVNALRNKCAHIHAHKITLRDVDRIGETVLSGYKELKTHHKANLKVLIALTLTRVYEPFLVAAITAELVSRIKREPR
jgi:hypothetical protein